MLILPLAPLDRAPAANNCNATSPVDNTTVTGAISDASGTTGYGTNTDNGNTYNILSGASVAGTGIGLRFSNSGTVNNFGTITGAGAVTFDCGIPWRYRHREQCRCYFGDGRRRYWRYCHWRRLCH